jgi:hypothetical protein
MGVELNGAGNTSRPANAAGFVIHSAVHQARPDVVAACYTHSPYGMAWSAFARPLEMLNQVRAIPSMCDIAKANGGLSRTLLIYMAKLRPFIRLVYPAVVDLVEFSGQLTA